MTLTVVDGPCSNTSTIQIFVDDEPVPLEVAPHAESATLCAGEEVQLFAGATGGVGQRSYVWTASTGVHPDNSANPVVSPEQTTTYTVVVSDQDGGMETGTVEVTVNQQPQFDVEVLFLIGFIPNEFCMNDPFYSVIEPIIGGLAPGTYTVDDEELADFDPEAAGPGEYRVIYTITDAETGCQNSLDFSIRIKEVPEVFAGGNKSIDYGSGIELDKAWATVEGGGEISYSWAPAELFADPNVLHPEVPELEEPTLFTFTATYQGCSASDEVFVNVTGGPLIAYAYVSSNAVCRGESVTLTAVSSGGAEGAEHTYTWTSSPEGFNATGETVTHTPTEDIMYILTVNDGITRPAYDQENVSVLELPEVSCPATVMIPVNATPIALIGAEPEGGYYTIEGNQVTAFDPGSAGMGSVTVEYVYTDGNACQNACQYEIVVGEAEYYNLTLLADPPGTGVQTGSGMFLPGAQITIRTTVPSGWKFTHWSGAGDELFGNIYHDQISFTMPEEDVVLTAHFLRMFQFQVSIFGTGSIEASGDYTDVLTGSNNYIQVTEGAEQRLLLLPAAGYSIIRIEIDGVEVPVPQGNEIIFYNVQEAHLVEVWYEEVIYTLTYHAGAHGHLIGEVSQQVPMGQDGSPVQVIPHDGWMFVQWSDGQSANPRTDTGVMEDVMVTAEYSQLLYEVTFMVNMAYARNYDRDRDKVYISGSMFNNAVPGALPAEQEMLPDGNDPEVLSRTLMLPYGKHHYKYFMNAGWVGEEWPSTPIRIAEVTAETVIYDYFGSPTDPTAWEPLEQSVIQVYPNPASRQITISSSAGEEIIQLRLINMTGQVVYLSEAVNQAGYQLSVTGLHPGIYVLQIETQAGWQLRKVQVVGER